MLLQVPGAEPYIFCRWGALKQISTKREFLEIMRIEYLKEFEMESIRLRWKTLDKKYKVRIQKKEKWIKAPLYLSEHFNKLVGHMPHQIGNHIRP